MSAPEWLGKKDSTRKRSFKQETSLAKKFGGRTTSGSGSVFGENDVKTDDFHIEAKTTKSSQYIFKQAEFDKMEGRTPFDKKALFALCFENSGKEYITISLGDFLKLTGLDALN